MEMSTGVVMNREDDTQSAHAVRGVRTCSPAARAQEVA